MNDKSADIVFEVGGNKVKDNATMQRRWLRLSHFCFQLIDVSWRIVQSYLQTCVHQEEVTRGSHLLSKSQIDGSEMLIAAIKDTLKVVIETMIRFLS